MRVQRLLMPDGSGSWTVLDDRGVVITPVEGVPGSPAGAGPFPGDGAQRLAIALAIALAAVHAARPGAIRELTLEDIDLPSRRISIAESRVQDEQDAAQDLPVIQPLPPRVISAAGDDG